MDEQQISFKHFTLFRRAVATKQTGALVFITHLGFAGRIHFFDGQLADLGDQKQLAHFFTQPMQQAHWQDVRVTDNGDCVSAQNVLANLLEAVQWNEPYTQALKTMLSKLPIVKVDTLAVKFEDYHIEICVSLLQRQAIADENFRPEVFLQGVSNIETLKVRLKVLLLAYACGLMNAKGKTQTKRTAKSEGKSGSIADRIFQRIKRIGTS